jgi:CsoR family transcriptional regulator, copper-sensing transcriptional repressor
MDGQKPKGEVLLRLRKIEGQLRGLQRMVEEDTSCPEIMTQVAAVTSAVKKVGRVIVQTYMEECLSKTERASGARRRERLKDLERAISQYMDWA